MAEKRVRIVNLLGLHARPAARFVRTANQFRSQVAVTKDGTTSDGKSILGILFLAAAAGSEIVIETNGDDEEQALDALVSLVANGLGEQDPA